MSAVLLPDAGQGEGQHSTLRRRSRADGRARRWDSGPAATARDLAVLRLVGEQYAVRVDVAAVLLARLAPEPVAQLSRRTVRQRLSRCEQTGWTSRRPMRGHTWVLPTWAGMRLAGLELDPWMPALDRLAHHHAVAVVRLHREPIPGAGGWVCERELWRRRGNASWHLADGALPASVPAGWQGIDRAWELVEVELHQKARPRLVAALKTRPPHTAAITYYVLAALHAPLSVRPGRRVGKQWRFSCKDFARMFGEQSPVVDGGDSRAS